jgi:hypothetical protein
MRGWIKKGIDTYLDFRSFKTEYPIVIIESDDWGSLRTKDKRSRDKLNLINTKIKNDSYSQLDSIATQEDLELLFEVLHSVKDRNGNPARITANVCTANPDFEAIRVSHYKEFFYKPFTKALEEYSQNSSLFKIWQKGIEEKVFAPQLHGREHVHGLAWLEELRAGNKDLLKAFELETWGITYKALKTQRRSNLQASLDLYGLENEIEFQNKWINDSLEIFKDAFGFGAKSFIAPAYIWHSDIYTSLQKGGINALQGIKLQYKPAINSKQLYHRIPHYTGQKTKHTGIFYTARNAFFEPLSKEYNVPPTEAEMLKITMNSVNKAIQSKKPVIIGSHRINFVGRLSEKYRDDNLKSLKSILHKIVEVYPDVEFMDSGQLSKIIKNDFA